MADVEQGSATTPRSPREVRPPTPEQIRAARNKLPEAPAARLYADLAALSIPEESFFQTLLMNGCHRWLRQDILFLDLEGKELEFRLASCKRAKKSRFATSI